MLPVAELNPSLLAQLQKSRGWPDERVVLGPGIGEDAAVIDLGDRCLMAKTDPITFVTDRVGWYLAQVKGSDLATNGAWRLRESRRGLCGDRTHHRAGRRLRLRSGAVTMDLPRFDQDEITKLF